MPRTEEVLAVYERAYDPQFPVVCFDERPCVLHGQPTDAPPLPPVPVQPAVGEQSAQPGRPRRASSTYVRQGIACLLAAFEPGTGQRVVEVSARRTGADYTRFLQALAADYPTAKKIVLVQDNLTTHTDAVFYQRLPAPEARGFGSPLWAALRAQKRLLAQPGRTRACRQCPPVLAPTHPSPRRIDGSCRGLCGQTQRRPSDGPLAVYPPKARVRLDRHHQKIKATNSLD